MSGFACDVSLMSGIVDLGGGGEGEKSISKHAETVSEDAWWLGRSQVRFMVAERFLRMPAKCGFW